MDIAVVIMVKNELDHIVKTFESVKDQIDTYVVLDTGSTDGTDEQVKKWCADNGKTLVLDYSEFVNFEKTRNDMLILAEKAPNKWLLLLDASDEVKGDWNSLKRAIDESKENPIIEAVMIQQQWENYPSITVYKNCRCVKNKSNWRFRGVVHEYITKEKTLLDDGRYKMTECAEDFYIYQDRSSDGNKSAARFEKDYVVLKEAVNREPHNERYLFYMAQTCRCLRKYEESCIYYRKYIELGTTFVEELFEAKLNLGYSLLEVGCDKLAIESLLDAFEVFKRIDPLIKLAEYYMVKKKLRLAYIFLRKACALDMPNNTILFVDKRQYEYQRWHLMGIVAFYVGRFEEGRAAAQKAILSSSTEQERELNTKNLATYSNK